jgi:hypothetical protein
MTTTVETEERIQYLNEITESLQKEKEYTYKQWRFLAENTDPKKLRRNSSTKHLLQAIFRHENHIMFILKTCDAKLLYKNNLKSIKDLIKSNLNHSELYQLYLQNHEPITLKPSIIEDFLQCHKKMNQNLRIFTTNPILKKIQLKKK